MTQKNLFISASLLEILNEIKDSSVVAQQLIDLSNDKFSHPTKEDCPDYLSFSTDDKSLISYMTGLRVEFTKANSQDFESEVWNSKRRYKARPGAVINKILSDVSPMNLEIFSNLYKSALGLTNFRFEVVQGTTLRYWYRGTKHSEQRGSLGASCMKYDHCQPFLDIYVDNEDIIKMLVMFDSNNKVMGRALLWHLDDVKLMDRIYTINDEELTFHFKMWAQKNDYYFKPVQRWNNTLDFTYKNETNRHRFQVRLKYFDYDVYPYLDTFKFLDPKTGTISNYKTKNTKRVLIHAEGNYNNPDVIHEDFIDGQYYHDCEIQLIEYDSEKICLRTEPVFVHSGKCVYSHANQCYILNNDAYYIEDIGDYVFNEKLKSLNRSQDYNYEKNATATKDHEKKEHIEFAFLSPSGRRYPVNRLDFAAANAAITYEYMSDPSSAHHVQPVPPEEPISRTNGHEYRGG